LNTGSVLLYAFAAAGKCDLSLDLDKREERSELTGDAQLSGRDRISQLLRSKRFLECSLLIKEILDSFWLVDEIIWHLAVDSSQSP